MSVDILLPSLARSSFSSMREIDEDELAELVETIEMPRLEVNDTDIGCVTLFEANSDVEDVVELEPVDTTIASGVEEIEDDSSVDGTIDVTRLEDADTDIGCVNLFETNSELEDVVVDSVETTNMPRVKGLITALIGCVVLSGTTVEIVEIDDTDIDCVASVDAEVEVEDLEEDIPVGVEDPHLLLVDLASLLLHGVELDFSVGLNSLCR